MWNMSTDLTVAAGKIRHAIRFVVVNNRVPSTDRHCALCGNLIEKGYIRDSQTRLIYCDSECLAERVHEAAVVVKNRRRKAL
jgi:hypothetical protein